MANSMTNKITEYLRDAYGVYQEWTLGGTPTTNVERRFIIEIAKMLQRESIRLER